MENFRSFLNKIEVEIEAAFKSSPDYNGPYYEDPYYKAKLIIDIKLIDFF